MDKELTLEDTYTRVAFFDRRRVDMPINCPDQRAHGWRLVLRRFWELIAYSDTAPTRFMLASAATFWCALLLLPGDSLNRPVYFYLALIAGDHPDEKWALVWAVYAFPMWWKIFSRPDKARWVPLLLNLYGLAIFSVIPVCFIMERLYPFPVGSGPYITMALAAAWVAVRTHKNPVRGWRGD